MGCADFKIMVLGKEVYVRFKIAEKTHESTMLCDKAEVVATGLRMFFENLKEDGDSENKNVDNS